MQRTKKMEEKKLKQDSKSRMEDKNVVVVSNPPGSSLLRCLSVVSPLSHCCRTTVKLLSLRYRYSIAPLSLRCRTAVAPLLSLRRFRAAVAPLSYRYRSTVTPLLSLLLSLRSRTAIAPVLLHCCRSCCRYAVATDIASAAAPLSRRCRTAITLLLLISIHC